jgi:hypothetical protein
MQCYFHRKRQSYSLYYLRKYSENLFSCLCIKYNSELKFICSLNIQIYFLKLLAESSIILLRRLFIVSDDESAPRIPRFLKIIFLSLLWKLVLSSSRFASRITTIKLFKYATSAENSYWLDDRGVGVRVPAGSRIFTSPCRSDRLWVPPNLLSNG